MKVCLINFPFTINQFEGREYGKFEQYEQNYELACIAAYLEQNNIEVDIIECIPMNYDIKKIVEHVETNSYDALVLAVEEYTFLNIARFLNKIDKGIYLIFAGNFSVLNYEMLLKRYSRNSFCLIANKETACLEVLQYIEGKTVLEQLNDVAYYDGNVIKKDISEGTDFSLFPVPKRIYISKNGLAGIESTRGCNNNCIYCTVNANKTITSKRLIQYKHIEILLDEITHLVEKKGVRYIRFHDENFIISSESNRNRLIAFCEAIEKKNWNIKFKIFARAVDIIKNQDILRRLKSIGLESVFVGVESFVQRQLDFYKKNTTVQQNIDALNILNGIHINYTIGFLPLDPYVSLDELEVNFHMVKESNYSKIECYANLPISCIPSLSVLNGSDFQRIINREGLNAKNDLGYKFVNKGIDKFFELKRIWCKHILPIHSMYYLIEIAEQKEERILANQLKNLKIELMELDLDALLSFVDKIKESGTSGACIEQKYIDKIQRIGQIYNDAKDELVKT